jgi:putative chitinase
MIQVDALTMHFSGANGERQNTIITTVGEVLAATLDSFAINTRLRIAHFLGQTCHESAGFRTTQEFASGEAYEGRSDLGNTEPGDGPRYKGRGLLQLTGRANYKAFGKLLDIKLEEHPELAAEPVLSLKIACAFWKEKNLNQFCDSDDIVRLTRRINGGTNGLDERRTFTSKAKTGVARIEGFMLAGEAPPSSGRLVLRRGSKGDAVGELQRLLQKLGFMVAVDDDFGAGTEVAVAAFQKQQQLDSVDGIVGKDTWTALDIALKSAQ